MTIVVGVLAPDGIVLSADSRTTYSTENGRHRIASDSTEKVFPSHRFAVATWGEAFIGPNTVAGVMSEFNASIAKRPPDDVEEFTIALGKFFDARLKEVAEAAGTPIPADEPPRIGFLVAGYDEEGVGHIREVFVPGPTHGEESLTTRFGGFVPRGQTDVINRLVGGIDWAAIDGLGHEIPEDLSEKLGDLQYEMLYPITVQDAIDLASFLIRTTIDMQRFSDGIRARVGRVPGCGGAARIVVVRRDGVEPVAWPPLTARRRPGAAEGAL